MSTSPIYTNVRVGINVSNDVLNRKDRSDLWLILPQNNKTVFDNTVYSWMKGTVTRYTYTKKLKLRLFQEAHKCIAYTYLLCKNCFNNSLFYC